MCRLSEFQPLWTDHTRRWSVPPPTDPDFSTLPEAAGVRADDWKTIVCPTWLFHALPWACGRPIATGSKTGVNPWWDRPSLCVVCPKRREFGQTTHNDRLSYWAFSCPSMGLRQAHSYRPHKTMACPTAGFSTLSNDCVSYLSGLKFFHSNRQSEHFSAPYTL